jgi:hypothetical protein
MRAADLLPVHINEARSTASPFAKAPLARSSPIHASGLILSSANERTAAEHDIVDAPPASRAWFV